jgi:glucose/arabinose dehydrogenase
MKKVLYGAGLLIVVGGLGLWYIAPWQAPALQNPVYVSSVGTENTNDSKMTEPKVALEIIAEGLTVPWEVLFLPNGEILITERPGRIVLLKSGQSFAVEAVSSTGEGGLLGAALHPDFASNNWLYLYQTTEDGLGLKNKVVRYILNENGLTRDRIIFDDIPGARFHDGGRIMFGPDGYLYVTVGDALSASEAANPNTLEGTLLRLTAEGEPAPGNPFGTAVYSYGHRNSQGLAFDRAGNLWSSEHGRSGISSGYDEINLIKAGANYGWPDSEGEEVASGTVGPTRHSTAGLTWAPGGLAYFAGSLYMPGLRGETLYEAVLEGEEIVAWHEHLVGEYGRLRTVVVSPDGYLYLTTSNQDGRGEPAATDDRLIRLDPKQLKR